MLASTARNSPTWHRRARQKRHKARVRVRLARLAGGGLPRRDVCLLQAHHSAPVYSIPKSYMGKKPQGSWRKQYQDYDDGSYGKERWRVWPGAYSPRTTPQRYDQYRTEDTESWRRGTSYHKAEATEQNPNTLVLQHMQKAVSLARKADTKIKKIKEEKINRTKQWDLYAADMRAKYLKQQQLYQQDLQRLDQEEVAAIKAGQEAAQEVRQLVTGGPEALPEKEEKMAGPDAWDALLQAGEDQDAPDSFFAQAMMVARTGTTWMGAVPTTGPPTAVGAVPPGLPPPPVASRPDCMDATGAAGPPVDQHTAYGQSQKAAPYVPSPGSASCLGASPGLSPGTRLRTAQPGAKPRQPVKQHTAPAAPNYGGPALAEKLEKRRAMEPFGLPPTDRRNTTEELAARPPEAKPPEQNDLDRPVELEEPLREME